MRENLVDDVVQTLEHADFEVSDTLNIRPKSFDVVARRGPLVLFVKVLVNVDGLDADTVADLKMLSSHLDASAVVVGEKTRDRELEDGVLYLRRGVPAFNVETAHDYFVEGVPPYAYMARGGLYVSLDGDLLSQARREEGMSLGQVANELGVSRRSVSKWEDGMDATIDVALELEEVFDRDLLDPVGVLKEFDEEVESAEDRLDEDEREMLDALQRTGFEVHPTEGAPFRAVADSAPEVPDAVLTGAGESESAARKRARLMSNISDVTRTRSIYLVDSSDRDSIENTVLIEIGELEDVDESEEVDEMYKEKSG